MSAQPASFRAHGAAAPAFSSARSTLGPLSPTDRVSSELPAVSGHWPAGCRRALRYAEENAALGIIAQQGQPACVLKIEVICQHGNAVQPWSAIALTAFSTGSGHFTTLPSSPSWLSRTARDPACTGMPVTNGHCRTNNALAIPAIDSAKPLLCGLPSSLVACQIGRMSIWSMIIGGPRA